MNRYTFAHIMRRLLHLHYDVRLSGMEHILDGQVHLVLPNHTAYIDPILLLANMWLAVLADVGVTVLAVLNSMRTLR